MPDGNGILLESFVAGVRDGELFLPLPVVHHEAAELTGVQLDLVAGLHLQHSDDLLVRLLVCPGRREIEVQDRQRVRLQLTTLVVDGRKSCLLIADDSFGVVINMQLEVRPQRVEQLGLLYFDGVHVHPPSLSECLGHSSTPPGLVGRVRPACRNPRS